MSSGFKKNNPGCQCCQEGECFEFVDDFDRSGEPQLSIDTAYHDHEADTVDISMNYDMQPDSAYSELDGVASVSTTLELTIANAYHIHESSATEVTVEGCWSFDDGFGR